MSLTTKEPKTAAQDAPHADQSVAANASTQEQVRDVSVIIRSYTKTDEVFRLIDGLIQGRLKPQEFVVIDSGSADWVAEGLREYAAEGVETNEGDRVPLVLIEIPNSEYSSSGSLNRAIRKSVGKYAAIVSQDAIPDDEHYLAALREAMDDGERICGAYGRQILTEKYYPLGEKDLSKTYPNIPKTQSAPDYWFVNTCSIVDRDFWDKHPFSEEAHISEDHEWAKYWLNQGYQVKYEPAAVVRHYHHFDTFKELWHRYHAEGEGLAYIHEKPPSAVRAVFNWMRELASDGLWLTRNGKPWHWPVGIYRRTVKHVALFLGYRAGLADIRKEQRASS
jgi:rhamnosyltransferase